MTIDEQARQMYREINEGWDTKDIHEICRKHLVVRAVIAVSAASASTPPRSPHPEFPEDSFNVPRGG
jgi:hypothetical protein